MKLTKDIGEQEPERLKHVDEFIDCGSMKRPVPENEDYARWVLNHFRLSALCRSAFDKFMVDHKLFCNFEGEKYRVTGASRMGDVWLTKNFNQDTGYQKRVAIDHCSGWAKE